MTVVDKRNLLPRLQDVSLELGCGNRKRRADAIGIDVLDFDCVDIVGDIYEILKKIKDRSIDAVFSSHFLEHVRDVPLLMEELARVMKPLGNLEIVVPHFSNPYFYSDYTHKNFFGLYSFSYLAEDKLLKRKVPNYHQTPAFELCQVDLIFKSSPPFYGRYLLKRLLQSIFNLNGFMREFYEENCCYLFPCYEIHFFLKRKPAVPAEGEHKP